jgi:hypothetical protein
MVVCRIALMQERLTFRGWIFWNLFCSRRWDLQLVDEDEDLTGGWTHWDNGFWNRRNWIRNIPRYQKLRKFKTYLPRSLDVSHVQDGILWWAHCIHTSDNFTAPIKIYSQKPHVISGCAKFSKISNTIRRFSFRYFSLVRLVGSSYAL